MLHQWCQEGIRVIAPLLLCILLTDWMEQSKRENPTNKNWTKASTWLLCCRPSSQACPAVRAARLARSVASIVLLSPICHSKAWRSCPTHPISSSRNSAFCLRGHCGIWALASAQAKDTATKGPTRQAVPILEPHVSGAKILALSVATLHGVRGVPDRKWVHVESKEHQRA